MEKVLLSFFSLFSVKFLFFVVFGLFESVFTAVLKLIFDVGFEFEFKFVAGGVL